MAVIKQVDATSSVIINSDDILYVADDVDIITTIGTALFISNINSATTSEVHNFGDIVALSGDAVDFDAEGTSFFNHGTVVAGSRRAAFDVDDKVHIQNFGLVQSSDNEAVHFGSVSDKQGSVMRRRLGRIRGKLLRGDCPERPNYLD